MIKWTIRLKKHFITIEHEQNDNGTSTTAEKGPIIMQKEMKIAIKRLKKNQSSWARPDTWRIPNTTGSEQVKLLTFSSKKFRQTVGFQMSSCCQHSSRLNIE